MAKQLKSCLLHLGRDSWQIFHDDFDDNELKQFAPSELLDQPKLIAERLTELGWANHPIVIGLSSEWCLAATVSVPSPQLLRKPSAMRYHLEQWIPWTAEEYVCDYIGHQTTAFMVAVRIEPLLGFLQSLEELGLQIVAICPMAILGIAEFVDTQRALPAEASLLWQNGQHVEIFSYQNSKLYSWSRCSSSVDDISRNLKVEAESSGSTKSLVLVDLQPEIVDHLRQQGFEIQTEAEVRLIDTARRMADRIVAGSCEPPFDLRKDELAGVRPTQRLGKEIKRLKLAAAMMLILLTAGLWLRGNGYQESITEVESELATIHAQVFPGKENKGDVRAEIDREFRQLQGTRSVNSGLPDHSDASMVLQRLLTALPADMRYRLPEVQIEEGRISLGGEVRSNTDADKIAGSLRQNGFTVESPKTQRLADNGFSIRLSVRPSVEEKAKKTRR